MQFATALRLVLPLALVVPLTPFAQRDAQKAAAPEDPYPPARVDTSIRFFVLDGKEVDRGKLEDALAQLGEGAALVYGPVNTSSRPEDWFVALETPAQVDGRDVVKAAKKGTGRAEQLYCAALTYDPQDLQLPSAGRRAAGSLRDLVIGMASELRWVDVTPTALLFFYTKGSDAAEIIERFDKLAGRKPRDAPLRDLVQHSVVWYLALPPEGEVKKAALRKLEKELEKLPGVASATMDEDLLRLFLTLRIEDLAVSGPGLDPPAREAEESDDEAGGGGGRGGGGRGGAGLPGDRISFLPRVDVNPLIDAIEDAGLVVEDEGSGGTPDEPAGG